MTDGQTKALFTLLEYIAKQTVAIRTAQSQKRLQQAAQIRGLRESNATLRVQVQQLTKENKELHVLLNNDI